MCIEDLACSFWRRNWFEIELWETHDMINPTSGWGQCSSVHEPLCLDVCLIQSLALKSMICAASCSMSPRRNEGMIWWSRLIIGFSQLSDYFIFYFFSLGGLLNLWKSPGSKTLSTNCQWWVCILCALVFRFFLWKTLENLSNLHMTVMMSAYGIVFRLFLWKAVEDSELHLTVMSIISMWFSALELLQVFEEFP